MIKQFLFAALAAGVALTFWSSLERRAPACEEPISYAIGTFDRRFDMSQADFLSALAEAEAVWESPQPEWAYEGRELFKYDAENASLPVSLIYDHRQAVTEELVELESEVKEDEGTYTALEQRYERVKGEYDALKNLYEARVRVLDERNAAYEARLERWNSGPRTSKREFEELEAEREMINAEVETLRTMEGDLNRRVGEINSLVDRLNRIAQSLNLNVEQYNTIGASRGETFEGGIYYSDADGQEINIYEFENKDKLIRILAHEFGHAIGLDHVDDPEAIMYHLNHGDAPRVTSADIAALENLCNAN